MRAEPPRVGARESPLPNSYWLVPGRLLGGEHPVVLEPSATRERLDRLLAAGIDCFLNLTQPGEVPTYHSLLPAAVRYHHCPIRDHALPEQPEHMLDILEVLESSLRAGRCVYVHCRAGIGRTNTVLGCLLVEHGLSGEEALTELNRCWQGCARAVNWPTVPETPAQREYVRGWRPALSLGRARVSEPLGTLPAGGDAAASVPARSGVGAGAFAGGALMGVTAMSSVRARFRGALVGLAAADALASTMSGSTEPASAWTDDTALALCLAESLLTCGEFQPRDQLERYTRWQQEGYLSASGECIGIRPGTARALAAGQWRRQLFPGSHDPKQLDPEPLSRVAPVVLYAFGSVSEAVKLAADAARVTCQAPLVVDSCRAFAAMLHTAIEGSPKAEVLSSKAQLASLPALRPRVRSVLQGHFRNKTREQIQPRESIVEVLEASLWCFERSGEFEAGARLAGSFGAMADVVAAAYGQLAGAFYGEAGIPVPLRQGLPGLDLIVGFADSLWDHAEDASSGDTRDSLR